MEPMCMTYVRSLFYNFKRSVTQLGYSYIYYNLTQKKKRANILPFQGYMYLYLCILYFRMSV